MKNLGDVEAIHDA